jgi:hypothetical protein
MMMRRRRRRRRSPFQVTHQVVLKENSLTHFLRVVVVV